MFQVQKMLAKGAEAHVYYGLWITRPAIMKLRVPKKWRCPELDLRLRQLRTKLEAKLLSSAKKAGVYAPTVLYVSLKNTYLIIEFIDGLLLRDALINKVLSRTEAREIARRVGIFTARLHRNGLIHGDLTTSNIIVYKGKPVLIDFGLGDFSTTLEDKGTELVVFEKSLMSIHYDMYEELWNAFIEGYSLEYADADIVLKRVKEIKMRGRYVEERRIKRFRH